MTLMHFKQVILFFFLVGHIGIAQQGNYKYNNFGNRTILLAGNVTGSVEDFGLAYYNPARLTEIKNDGFAFNAKAYEYSTYKLDDAIDGNATLRDSKFNTLPSMAAGTFSLFGTRFAYSVFTKYATNTNLNFRSELLEKDIIETLPGTEKYNIDFRINYLLREQLLGLTWAQAVTDKFSLGISLFGSIYRYGGGSNLEYTIQAQDNGVAYYQNRPSFRQDSYGVFVKIGGSYHFPAFDFGVNVNLPYMEVFKKGRFDYQSVISGIGQDSDQLFSYKLNDLESKRKEPLGISIGAGVPIARNKLHINLDYMKDLASYQRIEVPEIDTGQTEPTAVAFEERRKAVLNFGVGAEIYVNEMVNLYAGFSTDFNSIVSSSNIMAIAGNSSGYTDLDNDYFHTGFGAVLKFSWASLIVGATHTKNTTDFNSPYKFQSDDIDLGESSLSVLSFTRWQFIAGLDIPFLNRKLIDVQKGKTED